MNATPDRFEHNRAGLEHAYENCPACLESTLAATLAMYGFDPRLARRNGLFAVPAPARAAWSPAWETVWRLEANLCAQWVGGRVFLRRIDDGLFIGRRTARTLAQLTGRGREFALP